MDISDLFRHPYVEILVSVLITAAFYIDQWNGSVPTLPEPLTTGAAITFGVIIGASLYMISDSRNGKRVNRRNVIVFIIILTFITYLPSVEIPVVGDFVLISLVWGSAFGSIICSFLGRN